MAVTSHLFLLISSSFNFSITWSGVWVLCPHAAWCAAYLLFRHVRREVAFVQHNKEGEFVEIGIRQQRVELLLCDDNTLVLCVCVCVCV